MPRYLLHHAHTAGECGVVHAAWRGFDSPLRRMPTLTSCFAGGHAMWWNVDATDGRRALDLLTPFVASRTTAIEVRGRDPMTEREPSASASPNRRRLRGDRHHQRDTTANEAIATGNAR